MDALEKMKALYKSEINFELRCFWDAGWFWRLGDSLNGWKTADDHVPSIAEAVDGIWLAARRHFPDADCFKGKKKA